MKVIPRDSSVYEFLKSRIDLAEVVGQFAVLDGSGDTKVCLCPLKEQSSGNPGFKIYGDRFHCFSCGAWGDVVSFWRMVHELPTNWDAARDLARKYGITLPEVS